MTHQLFTFLFFVSYASKPHILFVMVDDFGWGNVGYHRPDRKSEVRTPFMDSLVKDGLELNRHYVHFACTPTRSSFQSGRLPVHVQLMNHLPCNPHSGIPENMTTIAWKMKKGGYKTHYVGKWDAGMTTKNHTPKGRGYDSSLNYFDHGNWAWSKYQWEGSENNMSTPHPGPFYDLWDTDHPAFRNESVHEEYMFRDRIANIVKTHKKEEPLFLMYAPKIAHYPLEAPVEYQNKFLDIDQLNRRLVHAMVNFLDDNLREIVNSFKANDLWKDTLMVLSTDNGGFMHDAKGSCVKAPQGGHHCFNGEAGANNFPLRGGKFSLFEGGIRGNAFVSGGYLPQSQRGKIMNEMMHITDWYATFSHLAGVDPIDGNASKYGLPQIDSLNMWPLISGQNETSPRETILINNAGLVHKEFKYIEASKAQFSGWTGPNYPNITSFTSYPLLENMYLDCENGCLFNVVEDPTEHVDLAANSAVHKETLMMLHQLLLKERKMIWEQDEVPDDPLCKVAAENKYNNTLGPWQ